MDVIEMHIKSHGQTMIGASEISKLTAHSLEEVCVEMRALENQGLIRIYETKKEIYGWHVGDEAGMTESICKELQMYHQEFPYRFGKKKAEIHMGFMKGIKANIFEKYVDFLVESGKVNRYNEYLVWGEFQLEKDEKFQEVAEILVQELEEAQYDFKRFGEIEFSEEGDGIKEDVLAVLLEEGCVVKVMEGVYTLQSLMEPAAGMIRKHLEENPVITIAQVRDLLNTSRKSAKPILEYLDGIKVTKKNGSESERVSFR